MREGSTVVIDGRDYTAIRRIGTTPDGEALWVARDEEGIARSICGPPWRLWTAPVRSGQLRPAELAAP